MAEKKKSNIEKHWDKVHAEKAAAEALDAPAVQTAPEVELKEGQIKCQRCGNVFEKAKAVYVALFGKLGCPKCGHSIE